VALPAEYESVEASFVHHPSQTLPKFNVGEAQLKLLIGKAFGQKSPVVTHSELFYLEGRFPAGAKLDFPAHGNEAAVYVVAGKVKVDGQDVEPYSMVVAKKGDDMTIEAQEPSHVMILGGQPVGERFIYWNFVASSKEIIEKAKIEWKSGPNATSVGFKPIPGDDSEFIPLPEEMEPPKGSIM